MTQKKWSMGILNVNSAEEVPGSVLLIPQSKEVPADAENCTSTPSTISQKAALKHTKDGRFLLDPQPDDDPNDPLNWPSWRKDIALLSLGWHCLVGGGQTPILAAGFGEVAEEFKVSFGAVALTTGLFMMGLGIGSIIANPLALLYGKRPVYLGGTLLFFASSIWCAAAKNYGSLLAGRIIMGIGISPCESLPTSTIAEIFFLHERASRISVYTLLLLGGKTLVPLASAVIINAKGWRWVFWIVAIIVGFNFFLLFFFVPETFWNRNPHQSSIITGQSVANTTTEEENTEEQRKGRHTHFAAQNAAREPPTSVVDFEKSTPEQVLEYRHEQSPTAPKTFVQSLAVFSSDIPKGSFLKTLFRPVILFLYPAILWSTVVYSLSVGWLIVMSISVAQIYQHHPYNFTPLQTGLVYISPFVGGVLGATVAGKLSDPIVHLMTRRNQGMYEPEFHLVTGLPVAICTALGLMGFGWSAENQDNWIIPTAFFGIISFGCSLGSTAAITFAVDSYTQLSGEALVTLNFSKNIFHGLVFSLFFNDWLEKDGSRTVFLCLGGIQLACLAFTVPLYIYGKRLRMWTRDFALG